MNNKRKTLKKVAGVSAVATLAPTSWTKPILNSVVLPAHAVGSCCTPIDIDVTISNLSCDSNGGTFTLCNNEATPLTLGTILRGGGSYTPILPIPPGQCSQVEFPGNDYCLTGIEIIIEAYLYDEFSVGQIEITFP